MIDEGVRKEEPGNFHMSAKASGVVGRVEWSCWTWLRYSGFLNSANERQPENIGMVLVAFGSALMTKMLFDLGTA